MCLFRMPAHVRIAHLALKMYTLNGSLTIQCHYVAVTDKYSTTCNLNLP